MSTSLSDTVIARMERLPITRLHRRAMIVLGMGTFLDSFDAISIGSALTVIFTSLHIGFVATGILIASGYFGQLIGSLLFGYVSEKWGRKTGFTVSLIVMAVFCLASAVAWDFRSLAVARALLGIGLGGEAPVAGAIISELVGGRRRGRYFLIYQSLYVWGALLAPFAAFLLIRTLGPELGWRFLLGIGALSFFVAWAAGKVVPESVRWLVDKGRLAEADAVIARFENEATSSGVALPPPEIRIQPDVKPTRFGELFAPAYRRRTLLVWLHWFLAYIVVVGTISWLPGLFLRVGHLTVLQSLMATFLATLAEIIVMYVVAAFIDRWGRVPTFTVGFAGMGVGALVGFVELTVFHVQGWVPLFVAFFIIQFFLTINATGCYLYVTELYPTRMRAWGSSTGRAVSLVASIIAPLSVGKLLESRYGAGGMFAMFAILSFLGVIVFLTLGIETKGRVLEELSQ
jgi:MFS transporter, putative metabolite:H+ symporter